MSIVIGPQTAVFGGSPSTIATNEDGFFNGYSQPISRAWQRRQPGFSFPHRLLALAQAMHAWVCIIWTELFVGSKVNQ
jgi:hypothetical protein